MWASVVLANITEKQTHNRLGKLRMASYGWLGVVCVWEGEQDDEIRFLFGN